MKRVWISDPGLKLSALGNDLQALGWQVENDPHGVDLRIVVIETCGAPCPMPDGSGPVVVVASEGDRLALSSLSLETQKLALAAAPAERVNAVAVETGFEDEAAAMADWLAGAEMVTGQVILLSEQPGPAIPF